MSLDIAPPGPPALATGTGPPGTPAPPPDPQGATFAALLARQATPPPATSEDGTPTKTISSTADTKRDEKDRKDGGSDNSGSDASPLLAEMQLVSVQALPPEMVAQAAAVNVPIAPTPLLAPAATLPAATEAILATSEAMDTGPAALLPALSGGTEQPVGGEWLPPTQLNSAQPAAAQSLLAQTDPAQSTLAQTAPTLPQTDAAALPAPALPHLTQAADTNSAAKQGNTAAGPNVPLAAAQAAPAAEAATALPAAPMALPQYAAGDAALPKQQTDTAAAGNTQAPARLASAQAGPTLAATQAATAPSDTLEPAITSIAVGGSAAQGLAASLPASPALPTPNALVPAGGAAASPSTPSTQNTGAAAVQAASSDTAAAQAAKSAAQSYAPFAQITLQNLRRPANNKGEGALTAVLPNAKAAAGSADASQVSPVPVLAEARGARGSKGDMGTGDAEDAASKDKAAAASDMALVPTPADAQQPQGSSIKTVTGPTLTVQDRAALVQQASEALRALHAPLLRSGHGQMTLQLHPQDWGALQVSITTAPGADGAGGTAVTAHLVAGSAAVKQALEAQTADLHRTLREAGLHLERVTVVVRPAVESAAASAGSAGTGQHFGRDGRGEANTNAANTAAGTPLGGGGGSFGAQGGSEAQTRSAPAFRSSGPRADGDSVEETAPRRVSLATPAGRVDTRA